MPNSTLLLLVGFLLFAAPPVVGAPPSDVYDDNPPEAIKKHLELLQAGKDQSLKVLSEMDASAPYLRRELQGALFPDSPIAKQQAMALAVIDARIYARNKQRYPHWVAAGRIDLCTEFLSRCDKKDAFDLVDRTLPLREHLRWHYYQLLERVAPFQPAERDIQLYQVSKFAKSPLGVVHVDGKSLSLKETRLPTLVRADSCTVTGYLRTNWFLTVRDELHQALPNLNGANPDNAGEWYSSVVLVNNATRLTKAMRSLIICDGDVELRTELADGCMVVANGDIWSNPDKRGAARRCLLVATGDIKLPSQRETDGSVFFAGGKVTLGAKPKPTDDVREGRAMLPFGVRFLDPQEFGLALEAHKEGVRVSALEASLPFAQYGVKVGDVITAVGDAKTPNAAAFRRELRRALLLECAVLQVRRGDNILTRIVYLDGIPTPVAPAPREKR